MSGNYDVINETICKTIRAIYADMNDYLKNILDSPSTINRIFRYYSVGYPEDLSVPERYIVFDETIVRRYVIEVPKIDGDDF